MPDGSVFISYRRDDTAGEAGRLADHLTRRFGPGRVFIDIDTIAPGSDFVAALERALTGTSVVLVVIGRQWLTTSDHRGARRLDDRDDFVRREIETALTRGARVVPVLVQNAPMPPADALPAPLAALATRQAVHIDHEEFSADVERLAEAITPFVDAQGPPVRRMGRAWVAALVVGLTLIGALGWRWQRSAATASAVARAADEAGTREVAARRARQQDVDDLVRVAGDELQRGQLAEAVATLARAVAADADTARARALQEDVAMRWIRDLSVPSGQRFADAMKAPLDVLDGAAASATGAHQADLIAHQGWAIFLRWRDGERGLKPAEAYRQALAIDPTNPYANAMLAHWTLSFVDRPDSLDQARRLFRIAADAGRAADVVRGLQFSALRNDRSVESQLETIRVMDEMRRRAQPLRPVDIRDAWSTYYFALRESAQVNATALVAVLPPSEHLLTLQWAFGDYVKTDASRLPQFQYYSARLQAAAGDRVAARQTLEALSNEFRTSPGMLRDAVAAALEGLTERRR